METLAITDEQRAYAWRLIREHDFAKRNRQNGRVEDQYAGKLGETVFADAFAYPRPTAVPYDHGIDFTVGDKFVDLKTGHSQRDVQLHWTTNIQADQLNDGRRVTDAYLFAHINTSARTFTLIGWTRARDYKALARQVNVGDAIGSKGGKAWRDTFNARYDKLTPWNGYDAFALGLAMWGK